MRRVLTHPDARTVFFLDQAVLPRFQGKYSAQIAYLPDPVRLPTSAPTEASLAETRRRFGIPHDRKLFLMFGDLRARKGVWKLCAALHHLTRQELASICVAFVGHADPLIEERLRAQIAALADQPIVLVREPAYVSDAVRDQWFEIADVVLAPYILHTGSSGVLMLAAAHRRPSISQDFGQMGRLTDDFRLGVTADTRDPEDLARALRAYLGPEPPPGWDAEVAYEFARSQSCERFARALVDPLRPFMT